MLLDYFAELIPILLALPHYLMSTSTTISNTIHPLRPRSLVYLGGIDAHNVRPGSAFFCLFVLLRGLLLGRHHVRDGFLHLSTMVGKAKKGVRTQTRWPATKRTQENRRDDRGVGNKAQHTNTNRLYSCNQFVLTLDGGTSILCPSRIATKVNCIKLSAPHNYKIHPRTVE